MYTRTIWNTISMHKVDTFILINTCSIRTFFESSCDERYLLFWLRHCADAHTTHKPPYCAYNFAKELGRYSKHMPVPRVCLAAWLPKSWVWIHNRGWRTKLKEIAQHFMHSLPTKVGRQEEVFGLVRLCVEPDIIFKYKTNTQMRQWKLSCFAVRLWCLSLFACDMLLRARGSSAVRYVLAVCLTCIICFVRTLVVDMFFFGRPETIHI